MKFEWTKDNRKKINRQIHDAAADGLGDFSEAVLTNSNGVVPLQEGTLMRSGDTDLDRENLRATVFYDTPYAVAQHERTDYNHTLEPGTKLDKNGKLRDSRGQFVAGGGRGAKYLERTVKRMSKDMKPFIGERIKRVTK